MDCSFPYWGLHVQPTHGIFSLKFERLNKKYGVNNETSKTHLFILCFSACAIAQKQVHHPQIAGLYGDVQESVAVGIAHVDAFTPFKHLGDGRQIPTFDRRQHVAFWLQIQQQPQKIWISTTFGTKFRKLSVESIRFRTNHDGFRRISQRTHTAFFLWWHSQLTFGIYEKTALKIP